MHIRMPIYRAASVRPSVRPSVDRNAHQTSIEIMHACSRLRNTTTTYTLYLCTYTLSIANIATTCMRACMHARMHARGLFDFFAFIYTVPCTRYSAAAACMETNALPIHACCYIETQLLWSSSCISCARTHARMHVHACTSRMHAV
jgi:hypothetical protein